MSLMNFVQFQGVIRWRYTPWIRTCFLISDNLKLTFKPEGGSLEIVTGNSLKLHPLEASIQKTFVINTLSSCASGIFLNKSFIWQLKVGSIESIYSHEQL